MMRQTYSEITYKRSVETAERIRNENHDPNSGCKHKLRFLDRSGRRNNNHIYDHLSPLYRAVASNDLELIDVLLREPLINPIIGEQEQYSDGEDSWTTLTTPLERTNNRKIYQLFLEYYSQLSPDDVLWQQETYKGKSPFSDLSKVLKRSAAAEDWELVAKIAAVIEPVSSPLDKNIRKEIAQVALNMPFNPQALQSSTAILHALLSNYIASAQMRQPDSYNTSVRIMGKQFNLGVVRFSLFGREYRSGGCSSSEKLIAAKKLQRVLANNIFSENDLKDPALHNGRLGKLMRLYRKISTKSIAVGDSSQEIVVLPAIGN